MDIVFKTKKLQKKCSSAQERVKEYGAECGKILGRRLDEMLAADTLAVLGKLPQARVHELTGNLKGKLAVSLKHPFRLVFEPGHDPLPLKPDGGLDWDKVTSICILEVVDYHD